MKLLTSSSTEYVLLESHPSTSIAIRVESKSGTMTYSEETTLLVKGGQTDVYLYS